MLKVFKAEKLPAGHTIIMCLHPILADCDIVPEYLQESIDHYTTLDKQEEHRYGVVYPEGKTSALSSENLTRYLPSL